MNRTRNHVWTSKEDSIIIAERTGTLLTPIASLATKLKVSTSQLKRRITYLEDKKKLDKGPSAKEGSYIYAS